MSVGFDPFSLSDVVYLMWILDDSIRLFCNIYIVVAFPCRSEYFSFLLYRADISLQAVYISIYLSIVVRDLIYSCATNCISIGSDGRQNQSESWQLCLKIRSMREKAKRVESGKKKTSEVVRKKKQRRKDKNIKR